MSKGWFNWSIVFVVVLGLLVGCTTPAAQPTTAQTTNTLAPAAPTAASKPAGSANLILATTTSTQDSGLLDVILPDFEQANGVEVDVVAVGTGQAIKLGEDGNADVLLVHARAQEDAFMQAGHGVRREDVMYNDFVIVGPESDPAGIKGMASATEAFVKIAQAQQPFVSRGDNSGTHSKEKAVWKAANIEPSGSWYISAGQGMGEVLTMADEQQAYTLSDRATYLTRTQAGLELKILVEGDVVLFNPYGVITVNPNKGAHIKADLANKFVDWIISLPTQEKIAQFSMDTFGQSLFIPDSPAWRGAHPQSGQPAGEQTGAAALKVTGKVDKEMSWTEAEVRAMPTIEAQSTNKQGETSTYTGVLITALLDLGGVQSDATKLVFVADDGYTAEVALADVRTCENCIVSFRNQEGFSTVLPGFPGNVQVKGVIEIQVD